MGDRREGDRERSDLLLMGPWRQYLHRIRIAAMLVELAGRQRAGELARIDRHTQLIPEMPQRANVILMAVGDHDRLQPVGALNEPRQIGEDQIHPRCRIHIPKSHAQIDKDQTLLAGLPVAVDIGIHAHFPRPAEGQVDQSVVPAHGIRPSWLNCLPCCAGG